MSNARNIPSQPLMAIKILVKIQVDYRKSMRMAKLNRDKCAIGSMGYLMATQTESFSHGMVCANKNAAKMIASLYPL